MCAFSSKGGGGGVSLTDLNDATSRRAVRRASLDIYDGFETGFELTEKVAPSSESVVGLVCHGGEVCEFEADEGAGGATSTRPMNESIDDEGAMDADDEWGGATVE